MTSPIISHWIHGQAVDGETSTGTPPDNTAARFAPVYDPALGVQTSRVPLADAATLEQAVASAQAGFKAWGSLSLAKRQAVMFKFRELLNDRKVDLAHLITAEHGKVIDDALGEIARGLEVVELSTALPLMLKGEHSTSVSTGVDVHSIKEPLGVVAIISPFNFPAMVPLWFVPVAIAAGNAVILKPSEKDPSAALWLAQLFTEAGLPNGVLNVLHGDKVAVDGILEHPDIKAISFVGSTPIAKYIYETAARHGKRVQALGGAKNHMLVLPDANLDAAATAAVNAGFGSAGERCMAISVLVAVGDVADPLIEKITEHLKVLRVGDGRRGCDMGPLVTEAHRDKVASYIDIAAADGATIVVDGRGVVPDGDANGFWLGPTLIDNLPTHSAAYTDEIFGPILAIVRVDTYQEAVDLINSSPYGNGTAIFTRDGGAARRFTADIEVGMVGINVPIPVPVAYHSFGGFKDSAFGDTKAYGNAGFAFFTREKVVTTRWEEPASHGLNLGFPQN